MENARFDAQSLFGDSAILAQRLKHPADDYAAASQVVWGVMRSKATGDPWTGNSGRVGVSVIGTGPAQALSLLWPELSDTELHRARATITRHLQESGNALCLQQGRLRTKPEWWVSEDWTPIIKVNARRKPLRVVGKPRKKREPKEIKAVPVAVEAAPVAVKAAPIAVESNTDTATMAIQSVELLASENKRLRDENTELRARLERISTAIKGIDAP